MLALTIFGLGATTTCAEPFDELIDAATRYARIRADWARGDRARRLALDAERSAAHAVLIDAFNILSRSMAKAGEDIQWRAALGNDRQYIGDVACHIHCLVGLAGR